MPAAQNFVLCANVCSSAHCFWVVQPVALCVCGRLSDLRPDLKRARACVARIYLSEHAGMHDCSRFPEPRSSDAPRTERTATWDSNTSGLHSLLLLVHALFVSVSSKARPQSVVLPPAGLCCCSVASKPLEQCIQGSTYVHPRLVPGTGSRCPPMQGHVLLLPGCRKSRSLVDRQSAAAESSGYVAHDSFPRQHTSPY